MSERFHSKIISLKKIVLKTFLSNWSEKEMVLRPCQKGFENFEKEEA